MRRVLTIAVLMLGLAVIPGRALAAIPPPGPQSGSIGAEAVVPGAPPSQAATIDIPRDGQSFNNLPITVSGFCPANTLVEIYKNNVFAGSANCSNTSYSLQIDLFDQRNDLVARVYDNLNQEGPKSATTTVYYNSGAPANAGSRISLTTQYAKRGANPGSILTWPITVSGGTGPYAISVDWGDKTDGDLVSQQEPGDVTLQHTYAQAGIYHVVIKASDATGSTAFLQLVGIGNGQIQQSGTGTGTSSTGSSSSSGSGGGSKILWWPIALLFALAFLSFWLGQKHQLEAIRQRLRRGESPF